MPQLKNIEWFKKEIAPNLNGYTLDYRFFAKGDFGSLSQVTFESEKIGGNIDFWGLGWLGIFIWDFEKDETLLNILLETDEIVKKEEAILQTVNILELNK